MEASTTETSKTIQYELCGRQREKSHLESVITVINPGMLMAADRQASAQTPRIDNGATTVESASPAMDKGFMGTSGPSKGLLQAGNMLQALNMFQDPGMDSGGR